MTQLQVLQQFLRQDLHRKEETLDRIDKLVNPYTLLVIEMLLRDDEQNHQPKGIYLLHKLVNISTTSLSCFWPIYRYYTYITNRSYGLLDIVNIDNNLNRDRFKDTYVANKLHTEFLKRIALHTGLLSEPNCLYRILES